MLAGIQGGAALKHVDSTTSADDDEPSVDDVMQQIRSGFKLKTVGTTAPAPAPAPAPQQNAAQAMVDALAKRRGVVSRDSDEEEGFSDDDWSD